MIARVVVTVALAACNSRSDTPAPPPPPKIVATPADAAAIDATHATTGFDGNVLVILIDTLRADRLGVAGYRRADRSLTPHLDAFAATATRFTHAFAHAANTPRSVPTLMTSRLPSQILFHKDFHDFPALLDPNVLLFEALASGGLYTTGFSSHMYFEPRRNIAQGFAEYDNSGALDIRGSNTDYAAPRIVPKVLAKLEALAQDHKRFAMFVHLFEPHSTYIDHPEYPVTTTGIPGLVERYDYEIAICDDWIGKILDTLDHAHLADHTMVVIVSDHGEAFGEHAEHGQASFFHSHTLYNEILRVPLLVRLPGVAPSVEDDQVGLVDVAPTIVDALGIPVPEAFHGRSLVPLLRGGSLPPRAIAAEIQPTPGWNEAARAFVSADGKTKLIVSGPDDRVELYDLANDPGEHHDLSARDPARSKQLRAELAAAFR